MRSIYNRYPHVLRMAAFSLVLALALEGLSQLCINLGQDRNPLYNYSTASLFDEPKDSLDVLAIGTSDIYSSVIPMEWWNQYGFTGYAWGEASQRIFETYHYLKKIYRVQSPKVVFLEVGSLYRDDTQGQVLDSFVKTALAQIFPVITYHRNLTPRKLRNLGAAHRSLTKGYFLRTNTVPADSTADYMSGRPDSAAPINSLCSFYLRRCVNLCTRHGSRVVLLSIPDRSGWNAARHDAVTTLAKEWKVPYLDLNDVLKNAIDWKTDTPDGGVHLNYRGAKKVTVCLGDYLHANASLPDHRGSAAYQAWGRDWGMWSKALRRLRLF